MTDPAATAPRPQDAGAAVPDHPDHVIAEGVDEEPIEGNRRLFEGTSYLMIGAFAFLYAFFHMAALNGLSVSAITGIDLPFLPQFPLETWNFRMVHIAGGLALGFLLFAAHTFPQDDDALTPTPTISLAALALLIPAGISGATALYAANLIYSGTLPEAGGLTVWMSAQAEMPQYNLDVWWFGIPLLIATFGAIATGWVERRGRGQFTASDLVLAICAVIVALYLIPVYGTAARNAVGTPFVPIGVAFAATAGSAMILELTRRVAGLALVVITGIFLVYVFTAHILPGILSIDRPYSWHRFFGHVYSDAGILGPTTAVSSTYIILFIIFAAFLQASKVGDYFVNFAFAAAGRARGGPAKVAIFASGLMGMINGTSAGNVVATGSLTIPLMKKVGYRPTTSGAVEAAASTGGQIMPPIMGAGAFIMAEITGIPYQEIAIAAIIPAILYFVSIYFMVDFEAAKLGMRGMRDDELPKVQQMVKQVYLFVPIVILIAALFMGYSVIRAGTLATVAAVVVSWAAPDHFNLRNLGWSLQRLLVLAVTVLSAVLVVLYITTTSSDPAAQPIPLVSNLSVIVGLLVVATFAYVSIQEMLEGHRIGLGLRGLIKALEAAGVMAIQIIAVCACAGIIVGVISLTGVGARFSSVLLNIAEANQLLALFFAMCIAILLGMGMPTTAAYAVAASVVAPGLIQLGIPTLTAHFFVFYFAVVSAITPPVALASYAAAGISGANPMATSIASFKIGISAFIVPFMFFYNSAILMDGTWFEVLRSGATAVFGVFLLSSGVQGWWVGSRANAVIRIALILVALFMIEGGLISDLIGIGGAVALFLLARMMGGKAPSTAAAERQT